MQFTKREIELLETGFYVYRNSIIDSGKYSNEFMIELNDLCVKLIHLSTSKEGSAE